MLDTEARLALSLAIFYPRNCCFKQNKHDPMRKQHEHFEAIKVNKTINAQIRWT